MIVKAEIKLIQSLKQKKFRKENNLFVAEGDKIISDLAAVMKPYKLFCTQESTFFHSANQSEEVSSSEMKKISFLKNPTSSLALFEINETTSKINTEDNLCLVLDNIQDPGNLGTIIRIADWYGINDIICSNTTVDTYNPKVIQATMGSIARVNIYYKDLELFLSESKQQAIYGAVLNGENIHQLKLKKQGLLIIGNEGQGISTSIQNHITHPITIPQFGGGESLNAAIATSIICDNFSR